MAKSVTKLWYRIALGRADGTRVLVAAEGAHLGEAIAAAERYRKGTHALAVDICADADVPLGESVGKERVVELRALPPGAASTRWPSGVMPQLGEGEDVLLGPRSMFAVRPGDDRLVIEAQTDEEHLVDLYLGLVERLPAADNLEIRVLDHFEAAGSTDVWLSSRSNAKTLLRFLDDFDTDFIGNGHVELSIYVRAKRATLRLTEHKTVVWIAEDRALEVDVIRWLGELGMNRVEELTTIAAKPHFHYRPVGTRDRKKLGELLTRQRMRRVDVLRAPPPDGRLTAG